MTKLEQIEILRKRANVSYEEARSTLDTTNGDLLEAIIYLEKQNKAQAPAVSRHFSDSESDKRGSHSNNQGKCRGESFMETLNKAGEFCMTLVKKGNAANLEVLKNGESKGKFPLTLMALLLIFLPYLTLPLIVIGLVFDYRYRFNGIHSHNEL